MPHWILMARSAAAFAISLSAIFAGNAPVIAANPLLEESWRSCTDSNPDTSIGACTAIIQSGGETGANLAAAFYNRGIAYRHKGQNDRAIQDYDRAIRLNPDDAEAFNNRAVAYFDNFQYDRAIQDYDQAIRLKPDNAGALINRGIAYFDKLQYGRAIEDYDQAIRLQPGLAEAFNNRSLAYIKMGQYDRAVPDFDQTIRLMKNYGNALINRSLGPTEAQPRWPSHWEAE